MSCVSRFWQSVVRESGWILALALAIFAAATRLQGVDLYWIHADEGIYFEVACAPSDRLAQMIAANAHPPGYYLWLRALAWFDADWATMRGLSAIAGAAAVFVGYLVGKRLLGTIAGLVAATLLCLSPGLTVLSQVVRPYTLQVLMLLLALLLLLRATESGHRRDWWGYGLMVLAALSLHYSSVVFIGAAVATLLPWAAGRRRRHRSLPSLAVVHVAIAAAVAGLYFVHVLPRLVGSGMQKSAQQGWLKAHFIHTGDEALANFAELQRFLFGQFGGVATVGFGLSLLVLFGVRRRFAILASVALAVAVLLSHLELYPFGPSRHSVHLVVFTALVIAGGIGWFSSRPAWGIPLAVLLIGTGLWQRATIDAMLGLQPGAANPRVAESNIRAAAIETARPKFERLKSGPACTLVLDGYSHGVLAPFFACDSTRLAELDGSSFRASRWGNCTILRHPAWTMVTSPQHPRAQRHLATLLRNVQTTQPRAAPGLLQNLYVAEAALFPGGGRRLSSGVLSVPRPMGVNAEPMLALKHTDDVLTLFRLDVDAYLAALARLPGGRGR